MTTTQPRNAQEAIARANRLQRARQILDEGYTFTQDTQTGAIAVCKPGELHASYWINLLTDGCDCPDAAKGNDCKHLHAWNLLQAERADEDACMEAQCRQYDEEEGWIDRAMDGTAKLHRMRDLLLAELLNAENTAARVQQEPFAKKDAVRSWANKAYRCKLALQQFDETMGKVQTGLLTL